MTEISVHDSSASWIGPMMMSVMQISVRLLD